MRRAVECLYNNNGTAGSSIHSKGKTYGQFAYICRVTCRFAASWPMTNRSVQYATNLAHAIGVSGRVPPSRHFLGPLHQPLGYGCLWVPIWLRYRWSRVWRAGQPCLSVGIRAAGIDQARNLRRDLNLSKARIVRVEDVLAFLRSNHAGRGQNGASSSHKPRPRRNFGWRWWSVRSSIRPAGSRWAVAPGAPR